MTLVQLEYLLAVAEHGNFTLAAEKSHLTQPTLSMQIQKLEEQLGVKIFNRNTKPITTTSVGEKIVAQSKLILAEAQRMQDVVDYEKGVVGGAFSLGIIPTVMPTLLPMFLNTFVKKYSKVDLKIEEHTTENMIALIDEGHLDAGIVATPLKKDKLKEYPLFYEPFVGYVPPNHPLHKNKDLHIEDLEFADLLVLEDGHCFRNHVLNLCQLNRKNNPFDIKSGSFETLVNLSDEGLGMTLLPYLNTQTLPKEKHENLRYFPSPPPSREISLVYTSHQLKKPVLEALKKTISGVIRGAIAFDDVQIISPVS